MGESSLAPLELEALQSSEERDLLDSIDQLRSLGIKGLVDLPQLVACGDQSSGKSSVLEAISGIPFPTNEGVCTRFATELILRRTVKKTVSVSIDPHDARDDAERQALLGFRLTLNDFGEFPQLVEKAKKAMGLSRSAAAMSGDVLRVEITGPDRLNLTIVDLPGLIHSDTKKQSDADVKLVRSLVRLYMSNPRSIILAVVSAKNDYANQIVLKLAKKADPKGLRTLGVITKPDELPVGSINELDFASLARNEDVEFRLGWHVVRNRKFEERDTSTKSRDAKEAELFSQGIWEKFSRDLVGIATLRPRLSKVLLEHIRTELPNIMSEINAQLQRDEERLRKLGSSRVGVDEQRLFLVGIGQSYQSIFKAAVNGTYGDPFFGEARSDEGYRRRLRAVIQNLNLDYAETMLRRGHRREISDSAVVPDEQKASAADSSPTTIERDDYVAEVRELLRRSRGRELPGMFNPMIVRDLFCDQACRWGILADQHLTASLEAARVVLHLIVSHLTDETTAESLLKEVVDPEMQKRSMRLNEKRDELMAPHKLGHPITYNHYFIETVQKVQAKRDEARLTQALTQVDFNSPFKGGTISRESFIAQIPKIVASIDDRTEADMDRYACLELIDCMEAYYKVALKSTVDQVAVQAVEHVLLAGLEDVLSPTLIMQMDSAQVSRIAAESQVKQDERVRLTRTRDILRAGDATCKQYAGRITSSLQSTPAHSNRTGAPETDDASSPGSSEAGEAIVRVDEDIGQDETASGETHVEQVELQAAALQEGTGIPEGVIDNWGMAQADDKKDAWGFGSPSKYTAKKGAKSKKLKQRTEAQD